MRVVAISALLLLALAAVAVAPTSAAMQVPPPCQYCAPPQCPGIDTIGPVTAAVRITVDDDCTVHVILLQAVACAHPLDGEWTVTEGRVSVSAPCKPNYGYCEPPKECAPAFQPPCCGPPQPSLCASVPDPLDRVRPVDVDVSDSCHVTVSADFIECLWGEQWNTVTAGPATVRYTTCANPGPPTQAAPCACPPPQPLCYQVVRALAENQYYSISDNCDIVVTLKADCGLQGYPEDHQVKAPKLTLNVQTCKYVPPNSPAMGTNAIPPCQCTPPPPPCQPQPPASAAVILPIPSVSYHVDSDCTISVTDTRTCPPGFENAPLHLGVGPARIDGVSCVPICRCMPIAAVTPVPPSAAPACASFHVEGVEASVWWSNSCHATVTSQDNLVDCVAEWSGLADPSVGPVSLVTPECGPVCACMPAASLARIDPLAVVP